MLKQHGDFKTRDWSFGGMCLLWKPVGVVRRGVSLTALINTAEGPRNGWLPISAIVTATSNERGTVSVRFAVLEDELKAFLNDLVPAKYRKA